MLKHLLFAVMALSLSACNAFKALDSVNEMPGKTDTMANKMDELHSDAKLAPAMDGLNDLKNQEMISPLPELMMPWGQIFAETATKKQILDYVYLKMQAIAEVNPSSDLDANGNEMPLSAEQMHNLRIRKNGELYSLFIISGYIPDAMLNKIIDEEIVGYGQYQNVALNILMFRVIFWRDLMLDSDILKKPFVNADAMNEAIRRLNKIEFVLELPFVNEISASVNDGVYKIVQFSDSLTDSGSLAQTRAEWRKAYKNAVSTTQSYQLKNFTGDARANELKHRSEMAAQTQAAATMKAYVDKWSQQPKP